MVPAASRLVVNCEGDPVTLGFFLDPEDQLHILMVNGSPCKWSRVNLKVNVDDEKLFYFDAQQEQVRELWPRNPRNQLVSLAPGEGRLFRVGGTGEGPNF